MQFTNSSLKKLVENLSDNNFKYLTKKFGSKNLEFLKQKGAYPYEYMIFFLTKKIVFIGSMQFMNSSLKKTS